MTTYKVYSLVSSKCKEQYIGMTGRPLSHRYSGHKSSFKNELTQPRRYEKIRALGLTIEDFKIKLIKSFENRYDAEKYEKVMIGFVNSYLGAINSMYVDVHHLKGKERPLSEATKIKIGDANRGKILPTRGIKKPVLKTRVACNVCEKEVNILSIFAWHNDRCRYKSKSDRLYFEGFGHRKRLKLLNQRESINA